MPVWSREELGEAVRLAQDDPVIQLHSSDLDSAFEKYGGIPRYLFEFKEEDRHRKLTEELGKVKPSDLDAIFSAASYVDLPRQKNTGMLIHIKPRGNDLLNFQTSFATPYIMKALAERYVSKQKADRDQFITISKGLSETATLYGHMLEAQVHSDFSKLQSNLKIRRLTSMLPQTAPEFNFITFPAMKQVLFESLSSLSVEENVYYYPKSKNFPTIDSFFIVPSWERLFKNGGSALLKRCLVLLQVTIAKKHKVCGAVIKAIEKLVKEKFGVDFLTVFVFVTTSDGIQVEQKITKKDGGDYVRPLNIPQYALCPQFGFGIG